MGNALFIVGRDSAEAMLVVGLARKAADDVAGERDVPGKRRDPPLILGDGVPAPLVTRSRVVRVEHEGACSSSLHAGLRALPDAVDAIAILPADQPGVSATLISLAVRSWLRSRPAGLTLSYRGEPGHPLVFAATLRDALGTLHGDKAMWHLLENLGDAVERIPVDVPCPQDIDTLEDYRSVLALAGHEG